MPATSGSNKRYVHSWAKYSFLVVSLCGAQAHAQDLERARQLFDEATTLREAGQYPDAVVRLQQAIEIKNTPGLQYHAGFCEAKQGHYRKAIAHFEQAAALMRAGATAPDVAALLARAHASALEHVAYLSVATAHLVPQMMVIMDDEPAEALTGREAIVDPGKHHVRVTAPGYVSEDRQITAGEAEHIRVEVSLTPTHPEPSMAAESAPHASPWKTVGVGTALGVTVIGLATGVTALIARNDAHVRVQAARTNSSLQAAAELTDAQHDEDLYSRWEAIGFVSAGVGAVSTVALWTLWPSTRNVSISVMPRLTGTGNNGFMVSSTF